MTIVYEKLMALEVPPAEQSYGAKDCMLYALGIGLGHDPMNEDAVRGADATDPLLTVMRYHQETKHHFSRYARSLSYAAASSAKPQPEPCSAS